MFCLYFSVQGMYKFLGLPDFSRTHIHTIGNNDWQGSQVSDQEY